MISSSFKKKITKIFRRLLEVFDMFAVKPSDVLTFKKEFYYSNWFTKTITVVTAISAFIYLIYQIIMVAQLTDGKINFYETSTINPEPLNFGVEGFFIAFGMQNSKSNEYAITELYEARLDAINKTTSVISNNLSLVPCSQVSNNLSNDFKNALQNNLSLFYCLENYNDLALEGTWDSNVFMSYQLTLRPAQNLSYDDANNFIDEFNFVMKYTTTQLDLDDSNSPVKKIVGDYFYPTDSSSFINIYFGFEPIIFNNNRSSLFDFYVKEYQMKGIVNVWEKYSAKSRPNTTLNDDFFTINLRFAQLEKQYSRTYTSLTTAFSNIGGLFNFITIIFNIFLLNCLRDALIQRISNEVLDYDEYIKMVDKDGGGPTMVDKDGGGPTMNG